MNDAHWSALQGVMGNPEWSQDPRYLKATGRAAKSDEIDRHVAAWTSSIKAEDVMARCQQASIPAGVVQNGVDLVEHDPQLAAHRFFQPLTGQHPEYGTVIGDRLPLYFSKTPCDEFPRSRELGEDNETILSDWLDMSSSDFQTSHEKGIFK